MIRANLKAGGQGASIDYSDGARTKDTGFTEISGCAIQVRYGSGSIAYYAFGANGAVLWSDESVSQHATYNGGEVTITGDGSLLHLSVFGVQ